MISIIISVLNNESGLKQTLASLVAEKEGHEVLVVDGGSLDGSLERARESRWVKLIRCQGTRAARLNAGAAKAKGDVLVFLDAGMVLERGWIRPVMEAAGQPGFAVGCFRMEIAGRNPLLRLIEWVSRIRTTWFRLARGSQALFARAEAVRHAQVFLDIPALEDLDFSRRMRTQGRVVQLKLRVIVPSSRWLEAGCLSRFARDVCAFIKWNRGAQPTRLASLSGDKTNAVILFCSNPGPGKVKKWLAKLIGGDRAAKVYQRTIDEILTSVERSRMNAERYVFFRPKNTRQSMSRWLGRRAMLIAQSGKTETERRKNAVKAVFEMSAQKAVILGPHCPALSRRELRNAVNALEGNDLVLGPTDDGGCYLVAVKQPHEDLFSDLSWHPEKLFEEITDAAKNHHLTYACLGVLRDFDSEDDLNYNWSLGYMQD